MTPSKDIPELQEWMNDFWVYVKRFYHVENSDKYWADMCDQGDALTKKYRCYFTESCVLGFIGWKENQVKASSNKEISLIDALVHDLLERKKKLQEANRKAAEAEMDKNQMALDDIWGTE